MEYEVQFLGAVLFKPSISGILGLLRRILASLKFVLVFALKFGNFE